MSGEGRGRLTRLRVARPRLLLAVASVAIILLVVATGAALGPLDIRRWLVFSALLAVIGAIQSVASDQGDLTAALLLSLVPVTALLADGSPSWLIVPLGVLLLVAADLSALSWDCQGRERMTAVQRQRLRDIAPPALLALAGSLAVVGVAAAPASGGALVGTVAAAAAAVALAAIGRLVFRGG